MRIPRALCLALLALPACSSMQTTAEVRNDSPRRVIATIELDQFAADADVLARAVVGAGETALLGPVSTPPFEKAELRVIRPGDLGSLAQELTLPRGSSVVIVEEDAWGTPRVRLLGGAKAETDAKDDGGSGE